MMDLKEIKVDLDNLANQLDSTDERGAMRLRSLMNAVVSGSNAESWSSANIHEMIAPDLIVERYKNSTRSNGFILFLEAIRNLLIFVPLVVTWYGISQAVTKYSDLIALKPSDIQLPFLFLWERGFDGQLQGWQTLGTLAWIDFLLLAGVVILTFLVLLLSDQFKARRDAEAEELRARLVHAITSASLYLNRTYKPGVGGAITNFNQSLNQFDTVIRALLQQIEAIANRQGQQQQLFDAFRQDLVTIMTRVSNAVNELKASNDSLTTSMNILTQPVKDLSDKAGPLTIKATEAVDELRKQVAEQQRVIQSLDNWGIQLTGVLKGVDQAVQNAIGLATSISKFTDDQGKQVQAMEKEREAQTQVFAQVQQISRSMKTFLTEIDTCARNLNNSVKYLDDSSRQMAVASDKMEKTYDAMLRRLGL